MQRYSQLLGIIQQELPKTIIEVGTWNGDRAIEMATQLIADELPCHYIGFDLFEDATDENDAAELNVKEHVSLDAVISKFHAFSDEHPGFTFELHPGNTRETLKDFDLSGLERPILAFIDGGHSVYTIGSDLDNLLDCDIIIMDDFYREDEDGKMPDITKYGCNTVLEAMGKAGEAFHVMPAHDAVKDGGFVQMASVKKKYDIQIQRKLNVKTKNAVSDDAIQRNILYALKQGYPEVGRYYPHDGIVSFVSGGTSFLENLDQIRADQAAGNYLVCVKTSHDQLIENGIIPDACILLDPRAHVVGFIENPHPDTQYYVASQVYWETMKHLVDSNSNVVLYHAMVNAGEQEMLGNGKFMVLGGSTSATRGISLLHVLGFRHFRLYGYDSSFAEKPGDDYLEEIKDRPAKRPMKVKVLGHEFWTTPELVAQSKDFEQLMDVTSPFDAYVEMFGSKIKTTMLQHFYDELHKTFDRWDWEPRKKAKAA